jgi:hypothetical protein
MLDTWKHGPAKSAIVDFVARVTSQGPHFVAAGAIVNTCGLD